MKLYVLGDRIEERVISPDGAKEFKVYRKGRVIKTFRMEESSGSLSNGVLRRFYSPRGKILIVEVDETNNVDVRLKVDR